MDCRRQIERWFAARGVPQLIEGFSTEQRMDARAVPFIGAWLVIGTFLIWGRRPQADLGAQILLSLAALAAILVVLGLVLLLRRHPPFRANARLDLLDIAMIGLVPSVAAAVVHGPTLRGPHRRARRRRLRAAGRGAHLPRLRLRAA
jgi:hypothetical protein